MSFIVLPKNAAKDAVLVEQKAGTTTTLDDSTPIEVNVQQPVTVNSKSTDPVFTDKVLTNETDTVIILNEISKKLDVLIKYEAMLHKVNLEDFINVT